MVTIKEFYYKSEEQNKYGRFDYDDGIIAVDENDSLVAVLRNDQYAHEGLNTSQFVEFLTKLGYDFDSRPTYVNEDEYKKICQFEFDND